MIHTQRQQALVGANELRIQRSTIRKELHALDRRAGALRMAELIRDMPSALASMYTFLLLQEAPGIGDQDAQRLMRAAGVGAWVKVGRLTPRQRAALADVLAVPAGQRREALRIARAEAVPEPTVSKPTVPRRLPGPRCERCGEGPLRSPGLCGWCDIPPVRSAA